MLDKKDKDFITKSLETIRRAIVKDVTDYLQQHVIPLLNEHEARLASLRRS